MNIKCGREHATILFTFFTSTSIRKITWRINETNFKFGRFGLKLIKGEYGQDETETQKAKKNLLSRNLL